jgi:serine/threonine-protein kinase RsbT
MLAPSTDRLEIASSQDIVTVRRIVRERAIALGFSLVDQTKLVTAASELARNTLTHGQGGTVRLEAMTTGAAHGLRLIFEDQGPGIADLDLAMRDGYTSGGGLGLGLSGSKRLCQEFSITSTPGAGTRVVIARWK